MGAGSWARRVLIGLLGVALTGLLLTGCDPYGIGVTLHPDVQIEEHEAARTIEERAATFCEARAEANRAHALYGLLHRQLLADGDDATAAWLRERFGLLMMDLQLRARWNDPRYVSLPTAQEPRRPELIALVCERCPQTADATTDRQRELWDETPGTLPMCADAIPYVDATPPEPRASYWHGVMVTTEVSFEHASYAPCPPHHVFTYPRSGGGPPECRVWERIGHEPVEPCQLADAEARIRALLPHQVEVSMSIIPAHDEDTRISTPVLRTVFSSLSSGGIDYHVTMTDDRITMRREDDQSLWEWQGNLVVDDAGQPVSFTGTFRGVENSHVAIRDWNDHDASICTMPGVAIEAPRGDRATFTGTFEVFPDPPYGN